MNKALDKIKEILWQEFLIEDVSLESNLKQDLGLDSLSLVSLLVSIEEEFKILFSLSDLNPSDLVYVKDIIKIVEKTL